MAAGSFSDDGVANAAKKLIPIYVDCTNNNPMADKYNIRGFPTVLFTDANGEVVDRLGGRDAASVIAKINSVVEKHSKAPQGGASEGAGLDDMRKQAVKDGKLIAIYFQDSGSKKKAEKHEALQAALDADDLAELKEGFVWIEQPVKIDGKRNPIARTFGVSSGPYLVFVDPRGDRDLDKKAVLGKTSKAKSLKDTLEGAVAKAAKRD